MISPEPLVSVLLPTFDAEATLPACLKSVERQTWRNWECVVVDDGSTDASLSRATHLARADPRIRVVSVPHRGLVAALNTGIEACRGDLVARMDADDLMHRSRLARQVEALVARPECTAVGSHVRLFPRGLLGQGYRDYEAWLNGIDTPAALRREAFVECPVAHPSLMLRRPALTALGYRDMDWPEDYDLVLRLLLGGQEIGIVPRRLLSWRNAPGRLSQNAPAYAIERFSACKAHFLAGSYLAGSPHYILWGYGSTGRTLRRALYELGKQPTHIIEVHPGRIGNKIHGAPVVPPERLPDLPRQPLIVSVAGAGPRSEVRARLASMGLSDPEDFVCAA